MPGRSTERRVLTTRELNRATLARQGLLDRASRPVIEVVDHLVGMQAQVPTDPYIALWSRLTDFDPAELEALLTSRAVARVPTLRGTLHLGSARDSLGIRPLVQPVLTRTQRSTYGKRVGGDDLERLVEEGRALLGQGTLTFPQLRNALDERWAGYDQTALTSSFSYLVPLVQVPPRGLWTKSGAPTWTTTEAWLGRPKRSERITLEELALRYLGAFGPASVRDMQTWCGLTRLSDTFDRLRPQLLTFEDERGIELFDLPDAPRPDAGIEAPVRFLPQYDNVFIGHADRSRIISEDVGKPWGAAAQNGWYSPLLVDGFINGLWKLQREPGKRGAAVLRIFEVPGAKRWTKRERTALSSEAERFVEFLAPGAESRSVEFSPLS